MLKLLSGPEIFTDEVNAVIDNDTECHRNHHRQAQAYFANQQAPQTKRHGGGDDIGQQADQADIETFERNDQDDGYGQQGTESGAQHVDDIAFGQVGKRDGDTSALRVYLRSIAGNVMLNRNSRALYSFLTTYS